MALVLTEFMKRSKVLNQYISRALSFASFIEILEAIIQFTNTFDVLICSHSKREGCWICEQT